VSEAHDGLFISGKPLREWKGEYDDYKEALNLILNKVEGLTGYGPVEYEIVDEIGRLARSALTGGQ
jgi:hypothetical protein